MMICIIFDFDGPILDSRSIALQALQHIWLDTFSSQPPDLFNIPLLDTKNFINLVLAKDNRQIDGQLKSDLVKAYSDELQVLEQNAVIDINIRKSLEFLKENNLVTTAIISNRRIKNLEEVLNSLGIKNYFDYLYGRDSLVAKPSVETAKDLIKKTQIEPENMIYIGDQDVDYHFCVNAGIHYYHAGYSNEPSNLSWKNAEFVFFSTKQLMDTFFSFDLRCLPSNARQSKALQEIKQEECCFFVGAGISMPSGIGNWDEAYKKIFNNMNLSHIFTKNNLTETLQLLVSDVEYGKRLFDEFKEYFSSRNQVEPNFYHYLLLNTKNKRMWTTNYDNLFEQIVINNHLDFITIKSDIDLEGALNKKMLIKMNGDFENAQYDQASNWNLIFSQGQFDVFEYKRSYIKQLFINDFVASTFIFVGVSFDDPILKRIIRVLKYGSNRELTRKHYYLTVADFDIRASQLQALKEKELRQYGINTLYFNNFDEIKNYLQQLYIALNTIKIGISGSIPMPITENEYYNNSLFTAKETFNICKKIGHLLATAGCHVYSGGAPFVGIPAVEGAFNVCSNNAMFFFRKGGGSFYQCNAQAKIAQTDNISDMRNEFIASVNGLVVIAGRLTTEDEGIIEELRLALKKRIPIIIFTQFGGQAYEYFQELIELIPKYYNTELSQAILTVNKKIKLLDKADVEEYIYNDLLVDMKELLVIAASTQIVG